MGVKINIATASIVAMIGTTCESQVKRVLLAFTGIDGK